MQSTSDAYRQAIAQAEQTPVHQVLVDWDGDGAAPGDPLDDVTVYVDSVTVDSSLTTDLPEEARLVTGYSSTEVTVELTGDPLDNSLDGARLWSPYNVDSPYYGKRRVGAPVSVRLGYETVDGPEVLPQITGRVRDLTVRGGSRSATLDALDGAESLRHRVTLPMVVQYDKGQQQGGLNSQWPIDYILRTGGFYASPPPRSGVFFSATLHGSFAPEVGTLASVFHEVDDGGTGLISDPGPVPYAQGQWGLAPTPVPGDALYIANYGLPSTSTAAQLPGSSVVMQGWVQIPSVKLSTGGFAADPEAGWLVANASVSDNVFAGVTVDEGNVATFSVSVNRSGSTAATFGVTVPPGWHYLGVQVSFVDSTHVQIRLRVDGTTTTSGLLAVPAYVGTIPTWTQAQVTGLAPCEAVQAWVDGTGEPTWDDAFTSSAILEPGLSDLTAIPTTTADDAWALLQEIVAAEQGTLWLKGDGTAVFWNRRHWRDSASASTAVKTLTTTGSIMDLSTVEVSDGTRNRVLVPYQPLTILDTGIIWQASGEPTVVPARGSVTLWADLGGDVAYQVDTTGGIIPSGGATVNNQSGYRAARRRDGSGGEVRNLTMTITPFTSTIKIDFANPNSFDAWLVSPSGAGYPSTSDGQASVALVGRRITRAAPDLDTSTVDPSRPTGTVAEAVLAGLDPADERLYSAPDSPWRQSQVDAQDMADDLLRALHRPMPQIQDLRVVADFALERGDRVQLQDPGGLGLDDPFWVVGLRTEVSASGATQSVTLRPVAAPGQWLWGVAGRNIFGVTPW